MSILLTGCCGFYRVLCCPPCDQGDGDEILNVDKIVYAASEAALEAANGHARHRLVKADITEAAAMAECFSQFQPDAAMHLAAETHVARSIDGPAAFIQTNVTGTFILLEAAPEYFATLTPERRIYFRFHHISPGEALVPLDLAIRRSPKPRPTTRAARFPQARPPPTTWPALGTTLTVCR